MRKCLITNNCWGFMLYREYNMRYESPTISMQIPGEVFWKFCKDLRYYLESELVEYQKLTSEHERYVKHLYGEIPNYPIGRIDDVVIVFQHYATFEDAKAKWDRRKARVDFDNVAYLFTAFNETYSDSVGRFLDLKLPHSVAVTEGFSYPGACRYDIPEGCDGFSRVNGRRVIEDNFSVAEWLEI